jgi:uncharacterized protein (DUF885 family)
MYENLLEALHQIDFSQLSEQQKMQYDTLEWRLSTEKERQGSPLQYFAIDHQDGFHLNIPILLQIVTEENQAGYRRLLKRMEGVPQVIDQYIELLRQGICTGYVPPRTVMESVPDQILSQITMEPEKSEFFQAFEQQDELLKKTATIIILDKIYPAYQKLYDFIVQEYIPQARETIAFSDLPHGDALYAQLIKEHTTTTLTPLQIHDLGLVEVKRIRDEMFQTMREAHFDGPMRDFTAYLKDNANFYYTGKEDLLLGYRDILDKIKDKMPLLFKVMPSLDCLVEAVPAYAEASSPMAYYFPGSVETGRAGRFFVNTHSVKDHPKWGMEALVLHEALPGHHYQLTFSQLINLPEWQKHTFSTAFVEGWGLYSESLGKELGFYQDPYSYFGRLTYEMLRAARLVVDTGIHQFGWTRDQAIAYFKDNLPLSDHEIISEIDRYIAIPGQALAYKVGELQIKSWRSKAEKKEGANFDLRAFHEKVLKLGSYVPLDVIDHYMQ